MEWMELLKWSELLKEHAKKIPCFCCVVQVPCSAIDEIGQVLVRDKCSEFNNWQLERNNIIFPLVDKIIAAGILEVTSARRKKLND